MSKYTTGEIAKLCGVSVRTVQYYDERNILVPAMLSEGGRRLYSEEDVKRLRIICFLRELGVPINSIAKLFGEEHPEKVIDLLLEQQEQLLQKEVEEQQKKLATVQELKRELKALGHVSVEAIGDIAYHMKDKNKLKAMRCFMVLSGIPVTLLQWTAIVLWIAKGLWWLFALWLGVAIPWGIAVSVIYFNRVAYLCPECHRVFHPRFWKAFWSYHTPKMRRLTCPHCSHKGMCVEVYAPKEEKNNG